MPTVTMSIYNSVLIARGKGSPNFQEEERICQSQGKWVLLRRRSILNKISNFESSFIGMDGEVSDVIWQGVVVLVQ